MSHHFLPILLVILIGSFGIAVAAQGQVDAPSGPVILTVASPAHPDGIGMDRAMLEVLPQSELRTATAWTDGVPVFKGPLVRDVLAFADATGDDVEAMALNNYWVEIPIDDFAKYDVILALEMDGQKLSRRDKGPIWIVYPRDDHSELQTPAYNDRWIWQLQSLTVR